MFIPLLHLCNRELRCCHFKQGIKFPNFSLKSTVSLFNLWKLVMFSVLFHVPQCYSNSYLQGGKILQSSLASGIEGSWCAQQPHCD